MTDARVALAWIALAWMGSILAVLTLSPATAFDETRYVGVAWEMLQRGDLLVPHLNGEPYHHKPPLLFWWLHGGWWLFGVNEWWPRVGLALFSLGTAALTAWLAHRLWPDRPETRWLAPVILTSLLLWVIFTPAVMFDVLLAFCVLVGVAGVVLAAQGQPVAGWLLVAVGIGSGILAKGPVALLHILPVAVLAPLWLRESGIWLRWYAGLLAALVGGAAVALAWAVPAALHGGEAYAEAIFWGQTSGRVVESFSHQRPWWWYLPLLPIILFPWLLWLTALRATGRVLQRPDRGAGMLAVWLLAVLLGFSAISGKQLHYLLPLFPGVALLLARGLSEWQQREMRIGGLLPAAVLMAAAALYFWAPMQQEAQGWPPWVRDVPLWLPLIVLALALACLWPKRQVRTQLYTLASASVLLVAVSFQGILGPAVAWYDVGHQAKLIGSLQREGHPIGYVGQYRNRFHFQGRLEESVEELNGREIDDWVEANPNGVLAVEYDDPLPKELDPEPLFSGPHRGGWMAIWQAGDLDKAPRP